MLWYLSADLEVLLRFLVSRKYPLLHMPLHPLALMHPHYTPVLNQILSHLHHLEHGSLYLQRLLYKLNEHGHLVIPS